LLENITLLPVYALIKHPGELLGAGFHYTTIYHTMNKKERGE